MLENNQHVWGKWHLGQDGKTLEAKLSGGKEISLNLEEVWADSGQVCQPNLSDYPGMTQQDLADFCGAVREIHLTEAEIQIGRRMGVSPSELVKAKVIGLGEGGANSRTWGRWTLTNNTLVASLENGNKCHVPLKDLKDDETRQVQYEAVGGF